MDMDPMSTDELSEISTEIMSCFQTLHGTADEATVRQLADIVLKVHSQAVSMASRLEDNQERITSLQRQIEVYEKNNNDLRTDLRIAKEEHEQAISKIDADFSKELTVYKKELEEMKRENRNVKAMNDRLMAEVQDFEATCLRNETLTKESIDELEKTKKELEETQDTLNEVRQAERKASKIVVNSASQTSAELTFSIVPPKNPGDTDGKAETEAESEENDSGELEDVNEIQDSSTSEETQEDEEQYERTRRSKCPSIDEKKFHRDALDESMLGLETEDESGIEEEERSLEEELNAVEKSEVPPEEAVAQSEKLLDRQVNEDVEVELGESEDEKVEFAREAILNSMHKLVAISDRVMDHIDDIAGPTQLEKLFSGCIAKRSGEKKGSYSKKGKSKGKKNGFLQCCGMVLFVTGLYLLCDFLCERYLGFGIFRLTRRRAGYTTAMF